MAQIIASDVWRVPFHYETTAGPLPGATIWDQAPVQAYLSDPGGWYFLHEDFDRIMPGDPWAGC